MITSSTLLFLRDLTLNNNREWFAANKHRYDQCLKEARELASLWIQGVASFDTDVTDNLPDKAIFRIYRDTRFSPDKTPYKNHIGMAIGKGGRTSAHAGYYLHIAPGESFIAGGKWMPPGDELKKIRQEIDYNYSLLQDVVQSVDFRRTFNDFDQEMKLKKPPKDYPADHPAIEWLKLRSFTVTHIFTDEEVLSPEFPDYVVSACKTMYPLISFLNTALEG
jgi:uncharacterized protein (TIGR02453 family)